MSRLSRCFALAGVLAATPLWAQSPYRHSALAQPAEAGDQADSVEVIKVARSKRPVQQASYGDYETTSAAAEAPEEVDAQGATPLASEPAAPPVQSHSIPAASCTEACECDSCGCECCECEPCCADFWQHRCGVWGGFLYLHAGDVDMAHAIQQNGTGGAGTVPDGRVGVAAPEYEPAFNVGASWAFTDCSSIWASYTHFESRTTDSLVAPDGVGGTVNSLVLHPGTINAGSTSSLVTARYDIDFDMLDLNFSRLISGSNRHAINYHLGAKYGSLEQRFGQRGVFAPPTGDLNTTSYIDFEGVGPRIGIDGRGRVGRGGFSVYGNTFLSFLLGDFQNTYEQFDLTTDTRQAYSTWTDARMVPLVESELGLAWTSCSGCFRVSAGYQLMWWFNTITVGEHVRAVQNSNFVDVGDTLTIDGLTTRVEWRF